MKGGIILKSIKTQLVFIICSLLIILFVTISLVNYFLIAKDYQTYLKENNKALSESLAANVNQYMLNAFNITERISTNNDTTGFDPVKQQNLLIDTVKRYPYIQLIAVHQLNGDQTARSSGKLGNRSDRWWFKKFIEEKEPYITKSYYSIATGKPVVTIVHGIDQNGSLQGVMMVDLETTTIQQMVEQFSIGKDNYVYLLDGEGVVVAHPDKQQVSEIYNYKNETKTVLLKDTAGNLINDEAGNPKTEEQKIILPEGLKKIVENVMNGSNDIGEYQDENGDTFVCAYHSIELPGKSDPWSLIVVQNKNSAMSFVKKVTLKCMEIGSILLILSVIFVYLFSKRLADPILNVLDATNKVKSGDLTVLVNADHIRRKDEIGRLASNFNDMIGNLHGVVKQIKLSTESVSDSAEELTASANETAHAANQVAESIVEVSQGADLQLKQVKIAAHIVKQMSDSIQRVADNSNTAAESSNQAVETARGGVRSIQQAVAQVNHIEQTVNSSAVVISALDERSKEIGQIVSTIEGIAAQTNLLALNAAIEAARAGVHGQGFAVVADEIRKLAEQSQRATKEITLLIEKVQEDTHSAVAAINEGTHEVKLGAEIVSSAGEEFENIAGIITNVSEKVEEISVAIKQISGGSQQIVSSINDIEELSNKSVIESETVSAATEEQLASMEEISASGQCLADIAAELQASVKRFRISNQD